MQENTNSIKITMEDLETIFDLDSESDEETCCYGDYGWNTP